MNIAFFHHTLRLGSGIDTVIYELANRLSKNANVSVYCFRTDYNQNQCKFELVEETSWLTKSTNKTMALAPFVLDKFGNLRSQLRQFDILNTHHYPANYISRDIDGPLKVVTEWSGAQTNMFSSLKEKLFLAWVLRANKLSARRADRVLAPCEFVREWIRQNYVVEASTMYLDGVNFEIFDKKRVKAESLYKIHPNLQGRKIILFVGRITESKNIHILINVFSVLRKTIPEAILVLVGDYLSYPYYYKKLKRQIESGNLEKDVLFTGIASWEDIPKYFAASSVYATCSGWEGFLRAEPFAFCKPIVCFNNGANSETVQDGERGYLVQNQDSNEFAERLTVLLQDESLARRLGQNGYEWCKGILDFDIISENFLHFCEENMKNKPNSS